MGISGFWKSNEKRSFPCRGKWMDRSGMGQRYRISGSLWRWICRGSFRGFCCFWKDLYIGVLWTSEKKKLAERMSGNGWISLRHSSCKSCIQNVPQKKRMQSKLWGIYRIIPVCSGRGKYLCTWRRQDQPSGIAGRKRNLSDAAEIPGRQRGLCSFRGGDCWLYIQWLSF